MIIPTFNPNPNQKQNWINQFQRETIDRLTYIGEALVRQARESGAYNDITGNLRASIVFGVFHNGVMVAGGEPDTSSDGSDKGTGARTGIALLNELGRQYTTGYVLIAVAGMNYAAHVESMGKDVLTGSGIIARNMLAQLFKK